MRRQNHCFHPNFLSYFVHPAYQVVTQSRIDSVIQPFITFFVKTPTVPSIASTIVWQSIRPFLPFKRFCNVLQNCWKHRMSSPRLVIRPVVRQPSAIRVVIDEDKSPKKIKVRIAIMSRGPIWNSALSPRLVEKETSLFSSV